MDREPFPTFRNKWDRITYLLGQFRFWIALAVIVAMGALLYFRPTVDVKDWQVAAIGAYILIFVASLPLALKFAEWLRRYRYVEVHHVNAVDDTIEKWLVPPAVWENKTVDGDDPWPVNDQSAWGVREFDWYESTDSLVVEGSWLRAAADDALATEKAHMEEMHDFLLDVYQIVGKLRGRFSRMSMDVERKTVNAVHEAQERGKMMDRTAVKNVWEDAAGEIEDTIPDDHPDMDDLADAADGDLPPAENRETPRDQMTPKNDNE